MQKLEVGMSSTLKKARLCFPATSRNRAAILHVLRQHLPAKGDVLEIASGSGEHAVYFQKNLPNVIWRASDVDPAHLESISAWIEYESLEMPKPLVLDANAERWKLPEGEEIQLVVCINMFHIVPWKSCLGLFRNASTVLKGGGKLYLYGPFKINGKPFPESNYRFDQALRLQDPNWGVRNLDKVCFEAENRDFKLSAITEMPANNLSVVFEHKIKKKDDNSPM